MKFEYCKIEVFIPKEALPALQDALRSVDAGHFGNYDSCMSYHETTGCWRPLEGSNPNIGLINALSTETEYKVECLIKTEKVEETIRAIKKIHPYEEPVINAIPLFLTGFEIKK